MFIRSHVSRPVSNWTSLYTTKILTLLNYKMGESVLAVNEVDCSSKKVKKISHTRWSKHWAEGALVGEQVRRLSKI